MSFLQRLALGYLGLTFPDLNLGQRLALGYLAYTAGGDLLQRLTIPPQGATQPYTFNPISLAPFKFQVPWIAWPFR